MPVPGHQQPQSWLHNAALVVNYGISNMIVLEIP